MTAFLVGGVLWCIWTNGVALLCTYRFSEFLNISDVSIVEMADRDSVGKVQSIERTILEAVGIGTWEWWLPENSVHYDEVWCRQLGMDPHRVRHEFETWRKAVHPEDLPAALAAVNRHLEGKTEEFWFVARMKHEDGHWLSIRSQGRCLIRDADGKPRHIAGTHVDVSADIDRDELSDKIQSLVRLGGWELDVATQKTKWTKETYRLHRIPYDTPNDKIMGISFYPEKERPRLLRYLEELTTRGTPFLDTFDFVDADGVEKTVRVSGEPVFSADGKIVKARGILQDVTEDLRREKEKEELRRQLLEAQAVARVGSWTYNVQTGKILWSDVMFDFFPEDRRLGPPSFEQQVQAIHPEDREFFVQAFQKALADGTNYRIRYRTRNVRNQELWLEGIGHATKSHSGGVVQLYGTSQDITDLVLAERRLQEERSKALHTAKLASLGEMSAGIAHEINNPLALIMGTASILPRYANDLSGLTHKAGVIMKAGERIDRIVNALRKYSRTNEKPVYTFQPLHELIRESIAIVEAKARRNGVRLDVCIDSETSVICDGAEIVQVIVNLLSNGIDAAKLEADKWVRIALTSESTSALMSIEDSGAGIASSLREKIFQPFFSTKQAGEGTGLGLSIAKGILDDHSASIDIGSLQGPTRFEVRFPKAEGSRDVA